MGYEDRLCWSTASCFQCNGFKNCSMNDQTGLDNEMCTLKSLFIFELLFEFHLNPSLSFADTSIPAFYDLFSYLTNF